MRRFKFVSELNADELRKHIEGLEYLVKHLVERGRASDVAFWASRLAHAGLLLMGEE